MKTRTAGKLGKYGSDLNNNTVAGLLVGGWELSREAAFIAPKDTGLMASSIIYTEPVRVGDMHYRSDVGPRVYYAEYVHRKYDPFLLRALNNVRSKMIKKIVSYILK